MSPEERIGAAVAAYLRGQGFAVYAEVVGPWGKQRPDIVAVKDDLVTIVECKVAMGWPVIGQALPWRDWADYVHVATRPSPSNAVTKARTLLALSLGWLTVVGNRVAVAVEPRGTAAAHGKVALLLDALRPEHQASRPGTASGEHYTQTQERDARIRALVAERPGVELREAIAALGLRLDAAGRRLLARHCRNALDGVQARPDGRRLLLWPAERTGI